MRLRSTLHLAAFELHLHDVWMLLNVAVHTTASGDFKIKPLPAIANAGHVPRRCRSAFPTCQSLGTAEDTSPCDGVLRLRSGSGERVRCWLSYNSCSS